MISSNMLRKPYLLKMFNSSNDLKEISKEIESIAAESKMEKGEVYFVFVNALLKNDIFFLLEESIRQELYYKALYWASWKETRQKNKPKSFTDVASKKSFR